MENSNKLIPIPGFEDYSVNKNGEVYSLKFNKIKKLKNKLTGRKYFFVGLCGSGKKPKHKSIHRLVAQVFLPNYSEKLEVNHINGVKTDNRLENLEMVTSSENKRHAYRIGLKTNLKGEKNPRCKISNAVVELIKNMKNIMTQDELANIFGISGAHISMIQTGKKRVNL